MLNRQAAASPQDGGLTFPPHTTAGSASDLMGKGRGGGSSYLLRCAFSPLLRKRPRSKPSSLTRKSSQAVVRLLSTNPRLILPQGNAVVRKHVSCR